MANAFDQFDGAQPPPAAAPNAFDQFDAAAAKPFNVLPFSEDAAGKVHFDPTAGILGSVMRAYNAPGDAYEGKFDPLSQEGMQRAMETAALISPANPAVRAGDFAIPGVAKNLTRTPPAAPTAEALKDAASSGYNAARATGATYPGATVGAAAQQTIDGLNNDGILAALAPQTHAVLGALANPPEGSAVTIASLDAARKAFGRIGGNFQNPTEQEAARRATGAIDQIIERAAQAPPVAGSSAPALPGPANGAGAAGPSAVTTPEAQAASLIQDARGNSAAAFRSDRVTNAEDAAELRAAAANSGQNVGNNLRQRLASLLLNPKQTRGYSQDELDAIRQVVQGTAGSDVLRHVGNMLGGGGGLGHTLIGMLGALGGMHFGGEVGAGLGAVGLPLLGSGLRGAYNSAVGRQVGNLGALIRERSPLYQQMLSGAPYTPANPVMQATAIREGLLGLPQAPQSGLLAPSQ